MSLKIDDDVVSEAITDEIQMWARLTCVNIKMVKLPELPKDDPLIAAAVWFNFGVDAGKNLSAVVTSAATKFALPLWLALKAQDTYTKYYQEPKIKNAQKMLETDYADFQSTLINGVNNAERQFLVQPYGRQVKRCLMDLFKHESFESNSDMKAAVRTLIFNAQVIQTDERALRQNTQKNLNALGNKLIALYEGTVASGRNHILYHSKDSKSNIHREASPTAASCRGRGVPGPKAPPGYSEVNTRDKKAMAELYANAHLMDVAHVDYPGIMPCYDTTYARDTVKTVSTINDRLDQSYKGTIDLLVKKYHDPKRKAG
jgi:hypothetical protein